MKFFKGKSKFKSKTTLEDIFRKTNALVADFLFSADEFIDKQKNVSEVDRK
jgi:hypothetical protein